MSIERAANLHSSLSRACIKATLGICTIVALLGSGVAATPNSTTYCFPITNSVGSWFLAQMQTDGTSTDSAELALRTSIGLPAAPLSEIVGVSDESKCSRASQAIDSANVGTPANSSLYLVRIGSHYMAFPPSSTGIMVHLDSLFTVRNFIAQQ